MLMNGKEVNHLIIDGETFDKSYEQGVKVKIVPADGRPNADVGNVDFAGQITGMGGAVVSGGNICIALAKYKNAIYIINSPNITNIHATGYWVSLNDVEFLK